MLCKKCNGTFHIKTETGFSRCPCLKKKRSDRVIEESGLPSSLRKVKTEDFKLTTVSRRNLGKGIIKQIKEYRKDKIFFVSSSTSEKERVGAILGINLCRTHTEIGSMFYTKLEDLTEAYFNKEKDETIDKNLPLYTDILILVIGDEIPNSAHCSVLYNVLYSRLLEERFTILLSSINKEMLRSTYKEKVQNFLIDNSLFFEC